MNISLFTLSSQAWIHTWHAFLHQISGSKYPTGHWVEFSFSQSGQTEHEVFDVGARFSIAQTDTVAEQNIWRCECPGWSWEAFLSLLNQEPFQAETEENLTRNIKGNKYLRKAENINSSKIRASLLWSMLKEATSQENSNPYNQQCTADSQMCVTSHVSTPVWVLFTSPWNQWVM